MTCYCYKIIDSIIKLEGSLKPTSPIPLCPLVCSRPMASQCLFKQHQRVNSLFLRLFHVWTMLSIRNFYLWSHVSPFSYVLLVSPIHAVCLFPHKPSIYLKITFIPYMTPHPHMFLALFSALALPNFPRQIYCY